MAREAFAECRRLTRQLDRTFGGPDFRQSVLEPMLSKERQITALQKRLERGGSGRGTDPLDLKSLLERHRREYDLLRCNCTLNMLTPERQSQIEAYIEARRRQIYLGDAEAVRQVLVWRQMEARRLSA